jgi:hypothetical protein
MKYFALPCFWRCYRQLSKDIRNLADKNHLLLLADPKHPSLQLKKVGATKKLWAARIGMHYRALGFDKPEGIVWFWIGSHADYDKILSEK